MSFDFQERKSPHKTECFVLENSTIPTTSSIVRNQTGMEENSKVLVTEGDREGKKTTEASSYPRRLSHVLLSNIYFIFQREIARDTPL